MKIKKSIFKNIIYSIKKKLPLCACGCGKEATNEKNKFIKGHNAGMKGKYHSQKAKLKMSKSGGRMKGKHHSQETRFKNSINNNAGMKGKHHSQETKLKMSINNSNGMKGKHHSQETKLKMSINHKNHKGMTGKHHSEESIFKMSLSRKKYIEENGLDYVLEGKNEKFILDQVKNNIGIELLRNNRNISKIIKGKSVDGYSPKYNLCIEVLEPYHFKPNDELSDYDQERQLGIVSILGCMIYYIPEQKFLSNPDKEIQRFKEFLLVLNQGKN